MIWCCIFWSWVPIVTHGQRLKAWGECVAACWLVVKCPGFNQGNMLHFQEFFHNATSLDIKCVEVFNWSSFFGFLHPPSTASLQYLSGYLPQQVPARHEDMHLHSNQHQPPHSCHSSTSTGMGAQTSLLSLQRQRAFAVLNLKITYSLINGASE